MATRFDSHIMIKDWRKSIENAIRLEYGDVKQSLIDEYIDGLIEDNLKDLGLMLVNNYTNKVSKVTALQLVDIIKDNHLIIGGGGCLFVQHEVKRNILIEFIQYIMKGRKDAKKLRSTFEKHTPEWDEADRAQLSFKLVINSLYGCMGYSGFMMFNIFLAEAITNQGRHIITSAINAIENFLGDSMYFENPSDVINVINTIDTEYHAGIVNAMDPKMEQMIYDELNTQDLVALTHKRFIERCIFRVTTEFSETLHKIFENMTRKELLLMYLKNNLMVLSKMKFIRDNIEGLVLRNGLLTFCEDWSYKDESCVAIVNEVWNFYRAFILYDYPIYDRLRKAMYLDKSRSLYTDTDSVFVSLDEYVRYIKNDVFGGNIEASKLSDRDLRFTSANITLSFANRMIDRAMKTLCRSIQITDEFAKVLNMKNEFFFYRILFTDVKKRYISWSILQEGQMINGGEGEAEIKGFDFIKNVTKPTIRKFYSDMCLEEILKPEKINPMNVFAKVMGLIERIKVEVANGSMEYFKQANVKKPEFYKNPYSTQGVVAVLLWNVLCPDKAVEFPTDVNVVPIKNLRFFNPKTTWSEVEGGSKPTTASRLIDAENMVLKSKNIAWYAEKYPEAFQRLMNDIYSNPNPMIRHMNLGSIAIPKNIDYDLPDHIKDLIDLENILNNTMKLILPVTKSIGIGSFRASNNVEYMSNIVSI